MALGLPEVVEDAHMGHPDFRVRGKIFATLCAPDEGWGMVKLTPEQQDAFVDSEPTVFTPVAGGWGRRGATNVRLETASARTLRPALVTAWRNAAPRTLKIAAKESKAASSSGVRKRNPATTPEQRYAAIVRALVGKSAVTLGSSGKKGFGSSALQISNKIFAMLSSKGQFVVKLPKQRVDALVSSGNGQRFDPGHGRLMKEWLAVEPTSAERWLALAREAMEFVASSSALTARSRHP